MKYSILLAPFPFGDLSVRKVRPVLALSEPIGKHEEILVAYISSNFSEEFLDSDLLLESSEFSGLKTKSCVRLHKVFCLPQSVILGKLGNISDAEQLLVQEKLKNLWEI